MIETIRKLLTGGAATLAALLGYMAFSAKHATIRRHEAVIGGSREGGGPTLFFISDIHRRRVSEALIREAGGPFDAVIIGGDLAEGGVPSRRIRHNVKKLARLGPVFYIWGNNDREAGEQVIRDSIRAAGGKVLDNESVRLPGWGPRWMLVGTDDTTSMNVDVQKAYRGITDEDAVIFVSHSPTVFRMLGEERVPAVRIAGHTHGGQIRLGRFGMLEKGAFRSDNGKVELISNGYGTTLVPLRLGAPAECHIIRLRAEKERK
ncbi:metallophosphoesterase [Edaphobacillus lindanitolerans]|uniref:metallophosphoesterase n=1 Tax=Edaphobacillus lindanitolerans TaxID=550447 RepID=UPI00135636F6|nr:metallophosphoesterase [Edaphobacillus lindanitolerans]